VKRLVQVIPHYSPPYIGGMEMRAAERADWLARRGWSVLTLTSSGQTHPHVVRAGDLTVRYLRSVEVAHTPLIFALPLALLRVPGDSIIQVETPMAYSPEVTALVCRLRRIPYVTRMTLDGGGHSDMRTKLLGWYKRLVLKRVYLHAALVIVLTPDDAALVTSRYQVAPERVRIIPNASSFTRAAKSRARPHEPFRLLFVGRADPQKNVPLLLRSVRRFLDSYGLPLHLDLVGDGEELPAMKKLIAELALADHVTLLGVVTGDRLEALYERADALVLTSIYESFGQVLLEAMTKAVPVVASNIRCVRTVVLDGTTGLLAELDEQSFAAAYYRLMTEAGLYHKLSAGALDNARRYDMATTIDSYVAAYDEVRGSTRHP
jgi:glycosyltransferase involved in cell wall biosynthesis